MVQKFTIGVSSRALFDLTKEHKIYEEEGLAAYSAYQMAHENKVLAPGSAFGLIEDFLALGRYDGIEIEVILMSRNNARVSLRIFQSITYYHLDITRSAFTGGAPVASYLHAYGVDLYLSLDVMDVSEALSSGIAAGAICEAPRVAPIYPLREATWRGFSMVTEERMREIRIAFDGDAVLFSAESQRVYEENGLDAFNRKEAEMACIPLAPGPFAPVLRSIAKLQEMLAIAECNDVVIRTALVTARSAPTHERVIRTLRAWGVSVDEAFFLGGMDKAQILQAFGAQIFFDDDPDNIEHAADVVLAARVPREGVECTRRIHA